MKKIKHLLFILTSVFFILCMLSCDKDDTSKEDYWNIGYGGDLVGRWHLVKFRYPFNQPPKGLIDCSKYDIICEFDTDGGMNVFQYILPDDLDWFFEPGVHAYEHSEVSYGQAIRVKNNFTWWYGATEEKLILDRSPLDDVTFYFVKLSN